MLKKMMVLAALMSTALLAAPQAARADDGHYEWRTETVREWVPARTERYQVQEWVPGRIYYVDQTQIVQPGRWIYNNGCATWCPPVTRVVRIQRQEPGCYRLVWRTRTIPGCYQNVSRRRQVWVPHVRSPHHSHQSPRVIHRPAPHVVHRPSVVVTVDAHRAGAEIRRSGRKIDKEAHRAGRRIGKELKRLFD